MNDDNARYLETISGWEETPDEYAANEEISSRISQKLQEFYETLTNPRDQVIWNRRLIADSPVSLQELGDEYGISKERVRQLEGRIKKNLKTYLEEELGEDIAFEFQKMICN